MPSQVKVLQIPHCNSPALQILDEIRDAFLWSDRLMCVVIRTAACSHAWNINEDEAEMLAHLPNYFEEEWARATPTMN